MVKDNVLTNLKNFNHLLENLLKFKKDFIELSIFSYEDQGRILYNRGLKTRKGTQPSSKSIKRYRELLKIDEDGNIIK